MGSRLLCCVALCLLGAGPLDSAVSQTPKYHVVLVGNKMSLKCEQNLGHNAMYWYKQDSKKLLKVMFTYSDTDLIVNETVPSRFSPESPDKAHLNLHVDSLEPVPMDSGITQTPKHLVMGMRNKKSLKCEQHLGHDYMYWYKQSAQKPLELMFVYSYKKLTENESVPSRFLPECPDSSLLYLHMDALEPEDTAMYFCASSKDTALQSHLLLVHKPPGSTQEAVFLYQQALGQGPQFLVQYYDGEEREKGDILDRLSGQQFHDRSSDLT
ncbi:hypothetical protein HPG69_016417 [Diceros bicornis minor]|uniref:Ig-like domain-containing protein n=1 Tax=Diceros bicornis minor TaxID=77932 RepID=A0A7J7EGB8_DICBM|nr:hypothetical protein HPG69_016417 [Diceros bicornis minor]